MKITLYKCVWAEVFPRLTLMPNGLKSTFDNQGCRNERSFKKNIYLKKDSYIHLRFNLSEFIYT